MAIEPRNARELTALGRLREREGDAGQALANYQRSLAINRFQPEISARVATLQAVTGSTSALMPPTTETRTVQQWTPSNAVRY